MIRILSPTAILGYGYPSASVAAGLARRPHVIGVDGGSTDPGPYYLGAGVPFTARAAVAHDVRPLLRGARDLDVPLIIGTSGASGGDPHLEWMWDVLRDVAHSEGVSGSVALIHAEQSAASLKGALHVGRIRALPGVDELTEADIDRSARIVAQMGVEPIQAALASGADIVLAGRSCDVSIFAAVPMAAGLDPALCMHAAKIVECGAYCAEPAGASDAILATVDSDAFVLESLNPARRVTAASAAAHSLYEQANPAEIVEPLGVVDLTGCTFRERADRTLEVRGSVFRPAATYTVKLEGAALVGYRAVSIAGIRDPSAITALGQLLDAGRERVHRTFGVPGERSQYRLAFRRYGADGVMGASEPAAARAHEVGLVIEAIAETQSLASDICSLARSTILHCDFSGRQTVGGNLALPFSPHDAAWGPAYEFSVYHVLEIDDPLAGFPIEMRAL